MSQAPGAPQDQAEQEGPEGSALTPGRTLLWIAGALALGWLFYALGPMLTPFAFAAILAYMLNPGVDALERRGLPRPLGTLLMIVALVFAVAALTLLAISVLQHEIPAMRQQIPALLTRLDQFLSPKLAELGIHMRLDFPGLRALVTEQIAASPEDIANRLLATLATVFLVPLALYYLLADWHKFIRNVRGAIPPRWRAETVGLAGEVDEVLSQYLRGQLLVMVVLATYYSVTLLLAVFDVALPVGMFTGLAVFVPYIGFGTGLVLAVIAALLQFGSVAGLAWVAVIYGFGQVLESFFLTPRLVGERIGLHPVVVIFALLAFGELFGFFGVASAILLLLLRRLRRSYLDSEFYNG
ncbi:MAG: AI-2E family transporter [Candidatus Protistobacter heckmanni]|nr:AI-2E family transporter [Candidatus Protistobacter heckmanni]